MLTYADVCYQVALWDVSAVLREVARRSGSGCPFDDDEVLNLLVLLVQKYKY